MFKVKKKNGMKMFVELSEGATFEYYGNYYVKCLLDDKSKNNAFGLPDVHRCSFCVDTEVRPVDLLIEEVL